MLSLSRVFLLVFIHHTLIRTVLSAPYLATRNITSSQVNIPSHVSSPITLYPLTITYPAESRGIRYHVPNTLTTLYFRLGLPCKEAGMTDTVIGARDYCEQQFEQRGDEPLPRSEGSFHEDLGYGAKIKVLSARPNHRLTWGILKDVMDGLWEFLVVDGRFLESEFHIYHGALDLVGIGTIVEAPETGERKTGDSVVA